MFLSHINRVLLAPDVPPSGGGNMPTGMGKEDIIDFLGSDDDNIPAKKDDDDIIDIDDTPKKTKTDDDSDTKKSSKSKSKDENDEDEDSDEDEESDELKDIEDELEDPTDEQLELVTPVRRKEILAKYPKLFKDFPYLEKAYYREQQFTQLFPTLDDAKAGVEAINTLQNFEADLKKGDTKTLLTATKNTDPKAFNKMVDNYLQVLNEVDNKAYQVVVGNTIKHVILMMVNESKKQGQENLKDAAVLLNQFVFMSSDYKPPVKLSLDTDDSNEPDELTKREAAFLERRIGASKNETDSAVNRSYKATISANIDPKESMSDYVRKTAERAAFDDLIDNIGKDSRFKIMVDKLWSAAQKDDFSDESVSRVRKAFVAKAKTLLPSVIKKARNEALRGMGKRVVDKNDDDSEVITRKSQKSEKSNSPEKDRNTSRSKTTIPKGMTSLEFLMSDD